jgi:tRNA U34 5-carboxymethylaminomethyl modifying GTPase MnmE/TrmE
MKEIQHQRSEAIEKDIKSQPEWKEFTKRNQAHQKLYDKIDNLRKDLRELRDQLDADVDNFNNSQGYDNYQQGMKYDSYSSTRPELSVKTDGAVYQLRDEITTEVRFAGMSGDFNPKEMIAELVRKFA